MADRNADALVISDLVLLEQPVLDAPAHEQAVTAIRERPIPPHDRKLRTAARMDAQAVILFRKAILDRDTTGNLKADAVPWILADDAIADDDILAFEKID